MDTAQLLERTCDGDACAPRRILFVCTGNTCRSPMAVALLNELSRPREICAADGTLCVAPRYVAASAGLYASVGIPSPRRQPTPCAHRAFCPHPIMTTPRIARAL